VKLVIILVLFSLPVFAATHQVALTWTQTIDPVALNCIARSVTSGTENFSTPLFCSTSPITLYTDTTVQGGDTWYYEVDAVNSKGQVSPGSNEVKTVIPLFAPTNLQAVSQ